MREDEERKAPRRASAAASRDNTWRPLASLPTNKFVAYLRVPVMRQINFTARVCTSLIGMHGLQLDIGARDSI